MLTADGLLQKLKNTPELDPDLYDGCYELMRSVVSEYAESGISALSHRDLFAVYTMAIGSWTQSVDFKKQKIDESNLSGEAKDRLKAKLDKIWADTLQGKYETNDIGLFGTGFNTFAKRGSTPSEEQVKRFIGLCIDVLRTPEDDEEGALALAEAALAMKIDGVRAAVASEILHCLRPKTFPIINKLQGLEDPYLYLGVKLSKKEELTSYVENARAIKAFRDANVTFKNYRVFDLASSEVPPFDLDPVFDIITLYKEHFTEVRQQPNSQDGEAFRWRALADFPTHWNIKADDFEGMLKESFGNDAKSFLNYYNIINMLFLLSHHEPEAMRGLFEVLTAPRVDIAAKLSAFIEGCDEIHNRHRVNANDQSFQKSAAATAYLFLIDPEHNYPFRESAFDKLKKLTGFSSKPSRGPEKVRHYYKFADALCQVISEDEELCAMSDAWSTKAGLYQDISRHALTDEIIYFAYKWLNEEPNSEWWPRLDEYDPGLTVEDWRVVLNNETISFENALIALKCFSEFPQGATCAEVADRFGRNASFYNSSITVFASKVHDATNCPMSLRPDGAKRRWALPCQGMDVGAERHGVFAWRLRPELIEALREIDYSVETPSESEFENKELGMNKLGRNIILYGPPGTGKTYNVAAFAWLIGQGKEATLEAVKMLSDAERKMAKDWYDKQLANRKSGQVSFTTFHQSYGYEEFIEGIRPNIANDDSEEQNGLSYIYEDGVFKAFCLRAEKSISMGSTVDYGLNDDPAVWKVSLAGTGTNPVRTDCLENGHIRIGWDEYGADITDETDFSLHGGKVVLNTFLTRMRKGDIVLSCYSATTIDAIGVVTGDVEWHEEYEHFKRLRAVKWIAKGIAYDIVERFGLPSMTLATVYRMRLTASDVLQMLDESDIGPQPAKQPSDKSYIFVIDEINRGNISKVFGELITLIEPTKRAGQPDQQSAILPYTKERFSVPSNVTIIGTMNTADRSIALIDTALRRRFEFIEVLPDYEVLNRIPAIEGIDVSAMVQRINERIAVLFDREHTIGHAYFMPLVESANMETLSSIFRTKIIPLLQEYFFDDYEKIRLVLADNQKADVTAQFIHEDHSRSAQDLFGDAEGLYEDIKTYAINEAAFIKPESYLGIYR